MSGLPLDSADGGQRYPGFDVTTQAEHWDPVTREVVLGRIGLSGEMRFFTTVEEATARALFDQLLYQHGEPRIDVTLMVDRRLDADATDGWHYDTMPPDVEAWRRSLAGLDEDARARSGRTFPESGREDQAAILTAVQSSPSSTWHGMEAEKVWSLWTRYGATAFYSHPWAWNEIGFDGPAYPRGYKNPGVDRLEGIEVHDALPSDDPVRGRRP